MEVLEYTRGPWTITENKITQWAIVGQNTAVAFIPKGHKNADGNSRLIMSAPELLHAAESALAVIKDNPNLKYEAYLLQTAIDKATK